MKKNRTTTKVERSTELDEASLLKDGLRLSPPKNLPFLLPLADSVIFTLKWNGSSYDVSFEIDPESASLPQPIGGPLDYGVEHLVTTVITDESGVDREIVLELTAGAPTFASNI